MKFQIGQKVRIKPGLKEYEDVITEQLPFLGLMGKIVAHGPKKFGENTYFLTSTRAHHYWKESALEAVEDDINILPKPKLKVGDRVLLKSTSWGFFRRRCNHQSYRNGDICLPE